MEYSFKKVRIGRSNIDTQQVLRTLGLSEKELTENLELELHFKKDLRQYVISSAGVEHALLKRDGSRDPFIKVKSRKDLEAIAVTAVPEAENDSEESPAEDTNQQPSKREEINMKIGFYLATNGQEVEMPEQMIEAISAEVPDWDKTLAHNTIDTLSVQINDESIKASLIDAIDQLEALSVDQSGDKNDTDHREPAKVKETNDEFKKSTSFTPDNNSDGNKESSDTSVKTARKRGSLTEEEKAERKRKRDQSAEEARIKNQLLQSEAAGINAQLADAKEFIATLKLRDGLLCIFDGMFGLTEVIVSSDSRIAARFTDTVKPENRVVHPNLQSTVTAVGKDIKVSESLKQLKMEFVESAFGPVSAFALLVPQGFTERMITGLHDPSVVIDLEALVDKSDKNPNSYIPLVITKEQFSTLLGTSDHSATLVDHTSRKPLANSPIYMSRAKTAKNSVTYYTVGAVNAEGKVAKTAGPNPLPMSQFVTCNSQSGVDVNALSELFFKKSLDTENKTTKATGFSMLMSEYSSTFNREGTLLVYNGFKHSMNVRKNTARPSDDKPEMKSMKMPKAELREVDGTLKPRFVKVKYNEEGYGGPTTNGGGGVGATTLKARIERVKSQFNSIRKLSTRSRNESTQQRLAKSGAILEAYQGRSLRHTAKDADITG